MSRNLGGRGARGKTTPRAMKWGTVMMLLGAALPAASVELIRMPPSPVTRWLAFALAVLGAMVVAYGHQTRPRYVGEDEVRAPDGGGEAAGRGEQENS